MVLDLTTKHHFELRNSTKCNLFWNNSCPVSNRYYLFYFFCNHLISNLSDNFPQQKIVI